MQQYTLNVYSCSNKQHTDYIAMPNRHLCRYMNVNRGHIKTSSSPNT